MIEPITDEEAQVIAAKLWGKTMPPLPEAIKEIVSEFIQVRNDD